MENEKEIKHEFCAECGDPFEITISEQEFYEEHNFKLPRRCKPCRVIRRKNNNAAYKKAHRNVS